MTLASSVLEQIEASGVVVQPRGSHLLLRPKSRLSAELLEEVRANKAEILAMVKVRIALAAGERLSAHQLQTVTDLAAEDLYQVLGELYDGYEIGTDREGYYWLIEPAVN